MFGIGLGELIVIAAVGIIFLGPERCVSLAKSAGKFFARAQREWDSIKKQVESDEATDITNTDKS